MTDKTVAELMALHHVAARKHAEWCMCGGPDEKRKAHESLQADVALEQAIRRAVDWGEPVAFVTEADQRCFHSGPGESVFLFTKKAKWNVPLYARNKP